MTYTKLQKLLPQEEINFLDDCEVFFNENPNLYDSYLEDYKFILFEYTTEVINTLKKNNIKYLVKTDSLNSSIILI